MSTNTKMAEAIELAEDAMAYVPEYFANKHGMLRRMAALKEVAAHDAGQAQEAQQTAGQEQDERDAFEAWAISYSTIPLKRDDDASLGFTGYTEMDQTMLWDAWQARAALAQRREPLQDSTLWGMWVDSPSDVLAFARRIERHYGIGATTGEQR